MVIYDLICSLGHQFEAWFPGHEAFRKQLQQKLVQCQVCGDTGITKLLSGGHFIQSASSPSVAPPASPTMNENISKQIEPKPSNTQAISPLDTVTFLKILKQYVTKNFEDVGPKFAQNIREIHQGEIPHKNIYGVVTPEEKEKLEEEEIPYFTLPEIPPEFEN